MMRCTPSWESIKYQFYSRPENHVILVFFPSTYLRYKWEWVRIKYELGMANTTLYILTLAYSWLFSCTWLSIWFPLPLLLYIHIALFFLGSIDQRMLAWDKKLKGEVIYRSLIFTEQDWKLPMHLYWCNVKYIVLLKILEIPTIWDTVFFQRKKYQGGYGEGLG